jgi:DNA-binding transcriptional regulator YdaS (Cro superfamily)
MKPQEMLMEIAKQSATKAAARHAARVMRATRDQIGSDALAGAVIEEILSHWQRACSATMRNEEAPDLAAFSDVMREAGVSAAVRVFGAQPATIPA